MIIAGCGGGGPASQTLHVEPIELPQSEWGVPFVHTPIAQATPEVQQWGKATAFVMTAQWHGTGFFISPDGLFLTNEHVVTRDLCNRDACKGFRVVREFAPGGDVEIFADFSFVAQSSLRDGLDFTLLKVRLKPGQTVPYLKLAVPSNKTQDVKEVEWRSLVVLGHPMGSSLRASPASFSYEDGSDIYLQSVAVSGNSGGPLIDAGTGNVIGLYHAGYWEKSETHSETGFTPHFGLAVALPQIWNQWAGVFPRVAARLKDAQRLNEQNLLLTANDFGVSNAAEPLKTAPKRYAPDVEATRAEVSGFFDRSYLDPQFEKLAFELVLRMRLSDVRHELAETFVSHWEFYGLAYGRSIPVLPRVIAELLSAYSVMSVDAEVLSQRIKTLQDPQAVSTCLGEANRTMPDSATYAVTREISFCGALASRHPDILESGTIPVSPLPFLLLEADKGYKNWSAAPLRRIFRILSYHLRRGAVAPGDYPRVLHALEVLAPRSVKMSSAFGAEGLHTLLLRAPQLVEPGFLR